MGTAFFWDEKREQFICDRRVWDIDFCGKRKFLFVFNNPSDFEKLMNADKKQIVYDEYGFCWTVDLLRFDILTHGIVIFCANYYKTEEEED